MFFNQPITVTRAGTGSYVGGIWQDGAPIPPFTLQASVQPVTSNDVQMLPEGQRQREAYAVFTADALKIADDNAKTTADVVTVFGRAFETVHSEAWQNKLIPHHKAVIVLQQEQA